MTMTLEELSDREEIRQVIYRWFRGADRLDEKLLRSAFWEDGEFEGGPNSGPARDFIPPMFLADGRLRRNFEVTNHYMLNMIIEWHGDHAITETYGIAYHRIAPNRAAIEAVIGEAKFAELGGDASRSWEFVIGIRYLDRLEKREGAWKIARKKLIVDWNQVTPYSGISEGGVYGYLHLRGARDGTDESYTWLPS
jgi:hypothetical protein